MHRTIQLPVIALTIMMALILVAPLASGAKVPLPERKADQPSLAAIKADLDKPLSLNLNGELADLNKLKLSKEQAKLVSIAIKEIYGRKLSDARDTYAKLKNPSAKKLVKWYELRNGNLDHSRVELQEFLDNNKSFPSRSLMEAKIERQYLKGDVPAEEVITHFKTNSPATMAGRLAHAEALLITTKDEKVKQQAIQSIRTLYQNDRLYRGLEQRILKRHEVHLRPEDHYIRMDRLFYQDRRSKVASALRTAKKLEKPLRESALFRAAVIRRHYGTAKKMLSKLDAKTKNLPGVYLARVQLKRRTKNPRDARKLLMNAKFKPSEIHDKDEWWIERRIHTRTAVNDNEFDVAYKIASSHETPSVNHYNEAEFMSGWIALRYLKKPKQAEKHFENFKKAADGPRTGSKSAYWMGRTQRVLKNKAAAEENFREGSKYYNTYYGQLSAQELEEKNGPITLPETPTVSAEAVKLFINSDEIKTLVTAHLAEQTSIVRIFFSHLRYRYTDTEQLTLLAELAANLGYNQSTVRIGKTAMSKDHPLAEYAYPVRFMPKFKPLRSIPENALIYAIARQESEFNDAIKSHAGARGLMQVMPRTLKGIARKYKIKWRVSWLTQKPAYNAAVGSAYVGDRHDEFGGSYIMTFAGFNAGPGRVRQWVREFGDPRSEDIDPIDWVERIPFSETRNYVQKVLANVQVYRARLGKGKIFIKSLDDLHRGKL